MLINFVYHFVFLPNKIEPIASIEFDWLTKKFQFDIMFDCRTNRTPIERLGSVGFDWFLVWFRSIDYVGLYMMFSGKRKMNYTVVV